MTYKTHKEYSICFAYIIAILMFKIKLTEINYYLMIPILLMTSKYGAKLPDVDHTWKNVHDKTVSNRIINFIIHITGGRHRSWQTHSIDIWVWFTVASFVIPQQLYKNGSISLVNKEVMWILFLGVASGWMSHLYSDMLTSEGVRLFCFCKFKIKFVPKKLFKLRFNTGNEWEDFNCKVMKYINIALGLICIFYPIIRMAWGY